MISSCDGIRNVSLVQNISQLKSDTLQKFQVKIRRVVKFRKKNTKRCKIFPKKNTTRCKNSTLKSDKKIFASKSVFLKLYRKCKICRFYGVKWVKTCLFKNKNAFRICLSNFFISCKMKHVVKFSQKNTTRCKVFPNK